MNRLNYLCGALMAGVWAVPAIPVYADGDGRFPMISPSADRATIEQSGEIACSEDRTLCPIYPEDMPIDQLALIQVIEDLISCGGEESGFDSLRKVAPAEKLSQGLGYLILRSPALSLHGKKLALEFLLRDRSPNYLSIVEAMFERSEALAGAVHRPMRLSSSVRASRVQSDGEELRRSVIVTAARHRIPELERLLLRSAEDPGRSVRLTAARLQRARP